MKYLIKTIKNERTVGHYYYVVSSSTTVRKIINFIAAYLDFLVFWGEN